MKTAFLTVAAIFVLSCAFAQPPGSDIYLFDLSAKKDKVTISNPVNITNKKGYDNQPFFHPDEPIIYYASASDTSGRTDILSYNYKTKQTNAVTQTREREYSPTVTPDKEHLSCIVQRDNNAQDLGKYTLSGSEPSVIIDNMTVGYHVWGDNSHIAMFILGTPNSLHYVRLPTKKDTVLAHGIGRSLHKVPGESSISFVHKVSEKDWMIKKFDTESMKISDIGPTITEREDLCWLKGNKILMSDGTKLFFLKDAAWVEVTVSPMPDLKGITRLAASADGKKLAVVVTEQ